MYSGRSTLLRVLGALLLIGLLIGVGVVLYQAGFSHGYIQGTLSTGNQGINPSQPGVPGYPYGGYWWGPRFGFFPFFPLFGFLFFGLFLFFIIRLLFFPRWWGYGRHWRDDSPEDRDRQQGSGSQPNP